MKLRVLMIYLISRENKAIIRPPPRPPPDMGIGKREKCFCAKYFKVSHDFEHPPLPHRLVPDPGLVMHYSREELVVLLGGEGRIIFLLDINSVAAHVL